VTARRTTPRREDLISVLLEARIEDGRPLTAVLADAIGAHTLVPLGTVDARTTKA
jgi:hypothetical protein